MQIQIFDDMAKCTDDEIARLLPLVSSQRHEEALKFKFTAGRFACLKSYMMLHDILADLHLIACNEPLIFEYGEYGKPFIVGRPEIHFNISHCPKAIAVVVNSKPVGIDIERFHSPNDPLLQRTMNQTERLLITSSDNPAATFTSLWTRKEALLKCLGTGIIDDITDVLHGIDFIQTHIVAEKEYVWSVCS